MLKANLEEAEQKFYNEGFDDAKCFGRKVIFDTWQKGFLEGWMAAVNALDLPPSSSFRDPGQVPLPEDPVEAPVEETLMMEEDSSTMRELVE